MLGRIGWRSRSTSGFAALVSGVARGGLAWHALSLALGIVPGRRRRIAVAGSASWVASAITVAAVKRIVRRRRPSLPAAGRAAGSSSMPSSHAANAAAYAAGATVQHVAGALTIVPAGVVAWSRLATRRHFPTDVVAGVALGAAIGVAVGVAVRRRGHARPRAAGLHRVDVG